MLGCERRIDDWLPHRTPPFPTDRRGPPADGPIVGGVVTARVAGLVRRGTAALLALSLAGCGGGATPAPKMLLSLSGSGTKVSGPFDAPSQWQIVWRFDCTARGKPGLFFVSVENDKGPVTSPPVQPPANTKGSGSDYVYKSGRLHLDVTADDGCSWTVTAMG